MKSGKKKKTIISKKSFPVESKLMSTINRVPRSSRHRDSSFVQNVPPAETPTVRRKDPGNVTSDHKVPGRSVS